ncbi:MAG: ASCH domain-containing protein [Candidatus Nezhaarchaeales archaeon]
MGSPNKGKLSFFGRHIMMKKEFADLVLAGVKTTTIRLGIVKPKRRRVILHGGGKVLAELEISDVKVKRVCDLTDEDARQDGFQDKNQLLQNLKEIYGSISPSDKVTIIKFKVIRRIGEPCNDESSRYLGLRPADIASIAMRYGLKLGPRDIAILKKVAETGSVRKAAIALFGTIAKRRVIRAALSRALKKLIETGIIERSGNGALKRNHMS